MQNKYFIGVANKDIKAGRLVSTQDIDITGSAGNQTCLNCRRVYWTGRDGDVVYCENCTPKPDAVNHPKHYTYGKIEAIDVIEDWGLDYRLGCALKYIARCRHKGTYIQDLKKAIWYLQRCIDKANS